MKKALQFDTVALFSFLPNNLSVLYYFILIESFIINIIFLKNVMLIWILWMQLYRIYLLLVLSLSTISLFMYIKDSQNRFTNQSKIIVKCRDNSQLVKELFMCDK